MNKFIPVLIAVLFLNYNCYAQNDTAFFDKEWHVTTFKPDIKFFRPAPVKSGEHWIVKDYYADGTLQMEGSYLAEDPSVLLYSDDQKFNDGEFKYYKDGYLSAVGKFEKGKRIGTWTNYWDSSDKVFSTLDYLPNSDSVLIKYFYFNNGNLLSAGYSGKDGKIGRWDYYDTNMNKTANGYIHFKNDILHGETKFYYKNGLAKREEEYFEGKFIKGKCYDSNGKEIPFFPYRVMPKPDYDIYEYLSTHIKYPKKAKRTGTKGRVNVKFVVTEYGKITNAASISPDEDPLLQEAAVKAVSNLPDWIPGQEDGKPVKVYYTLPITFKLHD